MKIGPVASEKAEDLWMFLEMKTSSLHYCSSRSLRFPFSKTKTLASSEAQLINEANQFCQSVGPPPILKREAFTSSIFWKIISEIIRIFFTTYKKVAISGYSQNG